MAENDLDYHIDEELEQIFHSDLQNLELGHNEGSHDDVVGDHLPEWLVGVIVVIIMLIVAFFVMIITSLIKNRQKNRASTYIGTNGTSAGCDDLESGKIGNGGVINMKMTSFTSVPDGFRDTLTESHVDSNTKSDDKERLTNSQVNTDNGVQGCRNPLFVDDEQDATGGDNGKDVTGNAHKMAASRQGSERKKLKNTANKQSSVSKKANLVADKEEEPVTESEADSSKHSSAGKLKSGSTTLCKRERNESAPLTGDTVVVNDEDVRRQEVGNGGDEKDLRSELAVDFKECGFESCCEDSGVELGSVECKINSRRDSLAEVKHALPSSSRCADRDLENDTDRQASSSVTTADVTAHSSASHQNQINIYTDGASVLDSSFGDLSPDPANDDCQMDNSGRCDSPTGGDLVEEVLHCSSTTSSSEKAAVQQVNVDQHPSCFNSPAMHKESFSCPTLSTTTQSLAGQDGDILTDLGAAMSTNL